jgi:hypothetical protein
MVQNEINSILGWSIGQVLSLQQWAQWRAQTPMYSAVSYIPISTVGVFDQDWGSTPCIGESL